MRAARARAIAVRPSASSAAAASRATPPGTSTRPPASTAARSAYPPRPPVPDTTRRPASDASTPAPVAATTPPTPLPGIIGSAPGGRGNGERPARTCVSTNVMPANATATTTCPAPATGSGAFPGTSASGGPNSFSHTARILDLHLVGAIHSGKAITERIAPQVISS